MKGIDLQTVTVKLKDRSYPILITANLLNDAELLQKYLVNKQLFFVSDTTVAPLYLQLLQAKCPQHKIGEIILPAGEQFKSLATLEKIFDKLMQEKFDRGVALCALGGGVIGDMTGFAAACYRRGVDFFQIPTTLLAQVDASIGGKTAVNHPLGKNMIGAFYQPQAVLIDVSTLKTLPEREYRAGLAEVVKYGLIRDKDFFYWLIQHADDIVARKLERLIPMIKRCCEIKAEVVSIDERESGLRAIFNLGHTFGHAIEAATKYKVWLHGEAVAIGIVAASYLSRQLNQISDTEFSSILALLKKFNLPVKQINSIDKTVLKNYMAQDKKIVNEKLKLILLHKIGEAVITTDFTEALLDEALDFI